MLCRTENENISSHRVLICLAENAQVRNYPVTLWYLHIVLLSPYIYLPARKTHEDQYPRRSI